MSTYIDEGPEPDEATMDYYVTEAFIVIRKIMALDELGNNYKRQVLKHELEDLLDGAKSDGFSPKRVKALAKAKWLDSHTMSSMYHYIFNAI